MTVESALPWRSKQSATWTARVTNINKYAQMLENQDFL